MGIQRVLSSAGNRYAGGSQMESVHKLFTQILLAGHKNVLFLADSRRSKLPLEPKGFPYRDEQTILFKSVHLLAVIEPGADFELGVRVSAGAPWLTVTSNGVVLRDEESGLEVSHITLEFDYKKVMKLSRPCAEVTFGFYSKQCDRNRANVIPWPLATTSCLLSPLAPNCTHQRNRVAPDHFFCRDPQVLVASFDDREFQRMDIRTTYGLRFEPRRYGPKLTSQLMVVPGIRVASNTSGSTGTAPVAAAPLVSKPARDPHYTVKSLCGPQEINRTSGPVRPKLKDRKPGYYPPAILPRVSYVRQGSAVESTPSSARYSFPEYLDVLQQPYRAPIETPLQSGLSALADFASCSSG